MKNIRHLFIISLLVGIGLLSIIVYLNETEKRKLKEDLIELSKIKYGLFSVDEWKKVLTDIITKKINEFNLEGANQEKMRKELESFLNRQINELEERYNEENSKSLLGILVRKPGASIFGIFGQIKKDIPVITDEILEFLNDSKNKRAIRGYIINKLNQYADKTFAKMDYSTHDQIIKEYKFKDRSETLSGLKSGIEVIESSDRPFQIALMTFAIFTAFFILLAKSISKTEYLMLTIISLLFLVAGLLLPMIEIDARISQMNFQLLGEAVTFQDQVLYYKSKSILEVVKLMITQNRIDLLFVGGLVLVFSVLFPIAKLLSSLAYLYSQKLESNKFIQFIIFKTGKWSMADVMVIAIFMAYIGFSGIITEQLKQIEMITQNIDILTTNKSNLLTGFFTFTSFVILSLLSSHKLQYRKKS
jgi:hypothetical protein